jgi:ankyrin repeat protein
MKEGLIAKDLKGELFHLAASQGNEETMEFLVKSNPASYNKESASAMLRDVCKSPISDEKSLDLIKTLCNQGADVYAIEQGTKESTLTLAASKGKVRVIEFLLGKKMDIHQTNSENQTALELICKSLASDKNTRAIVDQLISKGAQISSLNLDLLLEKPLTRDLVEQRQKR